MGICKFLITLNYFMNFDNFLFLLLLLLLLLLLNHYFNINIYHEIISFC